MRPSSLLPLVAGVDDFPYYTQDPEVSKRYFSDYYNFTAGGVQQVLGYVHKSIIERVPWPQGWVVDPERRELHMPCPPETVDPYRHRTTLANEAILAAKKEGKIKEMVRIDEPVQVCTPDLEPVFEMHPQGAHLFCTISFAVQLIAWTLRPEGKLYWLQRRALTKPVRPGQLDTIAAGGLHIGEKKFDAMAREAQEEASIPLELSRSRMKACGTLSYHKAHSFLGNQSSYPTIFYVYEMEMPEDFLPMPNDGEVDGFVSMTESQIIDALLSGDIPQVLAPLWVDHFCRHGIITADNEPHIEEISARLHRRLHLCKV